MRIIERILRRFGYIKSSAPLMIAEASSSTNAPTMSLTERRAQIVVPEFHLAAGNTSMALRSTEMSKLPKNYSIVPMSEEQKRNAYNALSVGAAGTNSAVAGNALSGLYRATVDPSTLMQLSSGGVGSAVMDGGKIVGQAGFKSAGLAAAAPVVVFQALSIVTGQYYLNDIKKQLKQLNSRIEKLIQMQESANRGQLDSICIFLRQLDSQNFYSLDDLFLLRQKMLDVQSMYFNYVEQMKIIAQDSSLEAMIKEGKFQCNSKQIKNTIKEYKSQEFGYLAQMANGCYQIYTMMELLHFKMLTQIPDNTGANIEKMDRIIAEFSSTEQQEHIALFEKVEKKILDFVETKADDSVWGREKAIELKDALSKDFHDIDESFENDELNAIKIKLVEPFLKKQDIYYDLSVPGQASIYIDNPS